LTSGDAAVTTAAGSGTKIEMRKQSQGVSAFAVIALTGTLPAAVVAQDRIPAAAGSSDAAAFTPQGLPLGGFRVYPDLRLSASYDDNVTQSNDRKRGDGLMTTAPSVVVRSNWSSHRLDANGYYRNTRYFKRSEQNHDEYGVGANGRLDVMRTSTVSASASYARLAQQRGTPEDLFVADNLIRYSTLDGDGSITHRLNRVALTLGASRSQYRYDDAVLGGTKVDQQFRNRDVTSGRGRIEYQYSAVTSLFITSSYNVSEYRKARPLFNRSSEGFNALGGFRFELSRLLSGSIGIGYIQQIFDDPQFSDFKGINYDVSLNYKPTELTSVTATAGRRLTDSSLLQVAGVLTHNVRVNVEHELLRNVVLNGYASYFNYLYRGLARNDNRYDVGFGARYKMNRLTSLALSGNRIFQDSGDVNGRRYTSNRATVSLIVSH
jgi:hypothetical protein